MTPTYKTSHGNQLAHILYAMSILAVLMTIGQLGCARQLLMETPTIVSLGGIDPFQKVPANRQTSVVPVFVASGRTISGLEEPAKFYTNDRSRVVRLGVATVEIGSGLEWPQVIKASTAINRKHQPEIRLAEYKEYGILYTTVPHNLAKVDPDVAAQALDHGPADRLVEVVDRMLAESRRAQITIYVHGFNTKFESNLGIAAEFWHYMGRDGVMMSFDWPSRASLFDYQADKANAAYATRQFRELLTFLAAETTTDRINILAHSAGCPIVIESLRDLSIMHRGLDTEALRKRTRIGRVVLAAPDMDLLVAVNAGLDGAGRVPEALAIYASTRDEALGFSGKIFGADRLGASVHRLTDKERLVLRQSATQAIDVTNAERRSGSLLGHSYYHQDPWVSSDLALMVAVGATPAERGLVRDDRTAFWSFPDDYQNRIKEIAKQLLAKYARKNQTDRGQ